MQELEFQFCGSKVLRNIKLGDISMQQLVWVYVSLCLISSLSLGIIFSWGIIYSDLLHKLALLCEHLSNTAFTKLKKCKRNVVASNTGGKRVIINQKVFHAVVVLGG